METCFLLSGETVVLGGSLSRTCLGKGRLVRPSASISAGFPLTSVPVTDQAPFRRRVRVSGAALECMFEAGELESGLRGGRGGVFSLL